MINYKDIVPHLNIRELGYHHVAREVFIEVPESTTDYKICDGSGEDPTCSD